MRWVWVAVLVPIGGLVLFDLVVGDWLFDVRPHRPAGPPPPDLDADREQIRQAFAARPPSDPVAREAADALRSLAAHVRAEQWSDAADRFDVYRLYDAAAAGSPLAHNPVEGGRLLRAAVRAVAEGGGWAFDTVDVTAVVPLPRPDDILVYVRQRRGGRSYPVRWWMTRGRGGWRIVDGEDLRYGFRLSTQAADLMASPVVAAKGDDVDAAVAGLGKAADALAGGHIDSADVALEPARRVTLPPGHFVVRCVLEGSVAVGRGEAAAARLWADRAGADVPAVDLLRASAHAAAGRWGAALPFARRYVDAVGPDATGCRLLGAACEATGRPKEAATAYWLALRDDPGRAAVWAALWRLAVSGG